MDYSRSKISRVSNSEIITSLPDNVIECILDKLPLQDAVRTSILSKNWRSKWVTNSSHLVFDDIGASICYKYSDIQSRIIKFVNGVLLSHDGPISKFTLSMRNFMSCPEIDQWITFLSRKNVAHFALEIFRGERYKLPSRLFFFHHLTVLQLRYCEINLPRNFIGFKSLAELRLSQVVIADDALERFISSCQQLQHLTLICLNVNCLYIHAPKLTYFLFYGHFASFSFGVTPRLDTLGIHLRLALPLPPLHLIGRQLMRKKSISLYQNMGFLSTVWKFTATGQLLKFMAAGLDSVPKRLGITLDRLISFLLSDFRFDDLKMVSSALLLIKSSPNLQHLTMHLQESNNSSIDMANVVKFLAEENLSNLNLKLITATVKSFYGARPEMQFVELILGQSPKLQKMIIEPNETHPLYNGSRILKQLICFPRASTKAKILYLDKDGRT